MAFVTVDYLGVNLDWPESFACLVLRWPGENRVLPLWIPHSTALRILDRESGDRVSSRPDMFDLVSDLQESLAAPIAEVRIDSCNEGVFMASVVLDDGTTFDARASDAVVLSRSLDLPLLVDQEVLAEHSLYLTREDWAEYFHMDHPDEDRQLDEAPKGDDATSEDFEALMESLGVSEEDLRGDDLES